MFVISKLDVKNNIVKLGDQNYESEAEAMKQIMNLITDDKKKYYVNKIKDNKYIEVYKLNKGYLYDSKTLINTYQILQVPKRKKDNVKN